VRPVRVVGKEETSSIGGTLCDVRLRKERKREGSVAGETGGRERGHEGGLECPLHAD